MPVNGLHIGIVVPRYGPNIYGGAEVYARMLALRLTASGHRVDIVTTTARSADTWIPAFPAGVTSMDGLTVRRFDPEPRQWLRYDRHVAALEAGAIEQSDQDELDEDLGLSPRLLDFLDRERERRDWWLFIPYLFSTTVKGLPRVPRSILVPCLHDEPLARRGAVGAIFRAATQVWYNTPEEAMLGEALFGRPGTVMGLGFEAADTNGDERRAVRARLRLPARYLLYLGRLEAGKGLSALVEWYQAYRSTIRPGDDAVDLVLAGPGHWHGQRLEGVTALGPVDHAAKWALYSGAVAYCLPSLMESLSIGVMEAWLAEVPVLVRAGSPVTAGHVRRSHGGLVIDSPELFTLAVAALVRSPALRRRLARSGNAYVRRDYSWTVVQTRMEAALGQTSRPDADRPSAEATPYAY